MNRMHLSRIGVIDDMKQFRKILYVLGLILLLLGVLFITILIDMPVELPDPAFEQAVREELNHFYKPLYKSQLLTIVELDLSNRAIESISGIGYFRNLEVLNLRDNKLIDVGALSSLSQLQKLDLGYNRIVDLEESNFDKLRNLPLVHLNLDHNLTAVDDHSDPCVCFYPGE